MRITLLLVLLLCSTIELKNTKWQTQVPTNHDAPSSAYTQILFSTGIDGVDCDPDNNLWTMTYTSVRQEGLWRDVIFIPTGSCFGSIDAMFKIELRLVNVTEATDYKSEVVTTSVAEFTMMNKNNMNSQIYITTPCTFLLYYVRIDDDGVSQILSSTNLISVFDHICFGN